MTDTFIERLIERHAQGLPGRPFQLKKAVLARYKTIEAPPTARQSAVLILLFPKADEWHVVLTERVGNENDPHSNQISFPGGSLEANDISLEACALRETHEERRLSDWCRPTSASYHPSALPAPGPGY